MKKVSLQMLIELRIFEIRTFGYMGGSSMPSQVCLLERQREIGTDRRGRGHETVEAEVGVMGP